MTASTALRIATHRPAERDEWENACRACNYATIFHTPLWADLFVQTSGARMVSAAEVITFSDGSSAVLPMVYKQYPAGIMRLYWSMPAHTFGGWVSSDALTVEHAGLLAGYLQNRRDLIWRENPYDPVLHSMELPGAREDFTQTIDLSGGFVAAAQRFDHAHRKAVKKASAAGVSIAEAVRFDEWESFFALYKVSRVRWKERRLARGEGYPASLLSAIYSITPAARKLWLARVNGTPAAGILCFYWNRHAVAWLGAGASEFFRHRPNNLLYEHVARHAAGEGFQWFDCNPSAGLQGVIEFKEHLGAIPLRSRIIEKKSPMQRLADGVLRLLP